MSAQSTSAVVRSSSAVPSRSLFRRLWLCALGAALVGTIASASSAFEEGAPGLFRSIWPEEVPAALTDSSFNRLDGNWAEWSQQATAEVARFYSEPGTTAAKQQQLADLKHRLSVMQKALNDSRYKSLALPLEQISRDLERRIDLADAALALDGVNLGASAEQIAGRAAIVLERDTALTNSLASITGGPAWRDFIKAPALRSALEANPQGPEAVAAAKATLERLAKVDVIEDAIQKAFLSRPEFTAMRSAVTAYVTVQDAGSPEQAQTLFREGLKDLIAGIEGYEAAPNQHDAERVRRSFQSLRALGGDQLARLSYVLQKHYFNYNTRIVASESFLTRLMNDSRCEQGSVVDCILGAAVSGYQWTNTSATINLKPSPNTIRLDLVLSGVTQSNTQGVTEQATVFTSGYHTFHATKEVNYNGGGFFTGPAGISVNANNTTTGATTKFSWVPLLGRFADNIAVSEAVKRKEASEQIAASRIQDKVLPRFNSEVDQAFAKAHSRMQSELFGGLRSVGLYPDAEQFETLDDRLKISTRLMAADELGGSAPPASLLVPAGANLLLHETILNNSVDRMGLAGKNFSEDELRNHIQEFLTRALQRPITLQPLAKPAPAAGEYDDDESADDLRFQFDAQDPIRLQVADGELLISLKATFQRKDKDDIKDQTVSIPVTFSVQNSEIVVTRGDVRVTGGTASRFIQKRLERTLPPTTSASGKVTLKGPSREVDAYVKSISLVDGWVGIAVE